MGPPDNWVPGIVPVAVVVGRSDEAAATLTRIAVFPAGFEFEVTATQRVAPAPVESMHSGMHGLRALHVGLEYANGARAVHAPRRPEGSSTGELRLLPKGGHGSNSTFRQTLWASPLPPPGPVTVAVAWPAGGWRSRPCRSRGQ